jgi:hypothetical protein
VQILGENNEKKGYKKMTKDVCRTAKWAYAAHRRYKKMPFGVGERGDDV